MRTAILCLLLGLTFAGQAADETLTFGVVPQQTASKLARLWAPLLDEISQQSGVRLTFRTARDIPTFEQQLARGEYDFAYMNPYHFTVFNESPGYRALAHARDKKIRGILIVPKDSPVQSIDELQGKTLAFPAPAAFAASILPRGALAAAGIDITPRYVSSHDSVYRTVAQGLYPAGGGVMRTFRNADASISDQLRILWTTEGYTPHAIASAPGISPAVAQRVQAALVALERTPAGQELLAALKIKGFQAATDDAWDDVRALRIDLIQTGADSQ